MMFIWIILIGFLAYHFYNNNDNLGFGSAKQKLDERLAKGEISIEEYKEIKKEIN